MIAQAISSAVDFLLSTRSPDGFWRDFWTPAGMSTSWVTGYVGAVLAALPLQKSYIAALEAWSLLESERSPDEGWGYNPLVPVDSDSTLWILRLAECLGRGNVERVQRGRNLLKRYMIEGGISTYSQAQTNALHRFFHLPNTVDLSAWFLPHTCVTAAAAGLSEFRTELTDYLSKVQQDDGSWACYWWFEPAYATALACKALTVCDEPCAPRAIERALAWARSRTHTLGEKPTPFELAWLLRILLSDGKSSAEANRCLDLLLSLQNANGAWRGSAGLRIPRPDESHPDRVEKWARWFGKPAEIKTPEETLQHTFTIWTLDQWGIFTTATVLAALQEAANVLQPVSESNRI